MLHLLAWLVAITSPTHAEDSPFDLVKSTPVVVNGLQFVASTQREWPMDGTTRTINIQLLVKNCTAHRLLFPTFDSFTLRLATPGGKDMGGIGSRYGTVFTEPADIAPGKTETIWRFGELTDSATHPWNFRFLDGTGSIFDVEGMVPGKYVLRFSFESVPSKIRKWAAFIQQPIAADAPLWSGNGDTKEVGFQIMRRP